ncbi:MAG: vitamin B6 photo-protection and homoeostasis-domain-containing protein [Monoraphidium minutum]|nr:MAG: vitamin B6 photo-protection and homoeostasis-domain-containing protein [Monoraphidium minutum]
MQCSCIHGAPARRAHPPRANASHALPLGVWRTLPREQRRARVGCARLRELESRRAVALRASQQQGGEQAPAGVATSVRAPRQEHQPEQGGAPPPQPPPPPQQQQQQQQLVVTQLTPTQAPVVYRVGGASSTSLGGGGGAAGATPPGPQAPPAAWARPRPLAALRALYLPEGFPAAVTPDYLSYQLVSVPTHIAGWLSHSLATSSLLKAVGISAGPAGVVAVSAAIKWIIKDGIGAAGRFLVGGRLGREFDDDPRRWRMTAEAITTLGLALEISTTLYPQHFLLLASSGNFAKALAKGMGKPVFRVIQTHFAAAGNVGAVAAKEEVWEVSAQLAGYAASIALLQALEGTDSWQPVVGAWALVQGVHVALRYAALSQLRFATLNQKRACALAAAHVAAVAAQSHGGGGGGAFGSEAAGAELVEGPRPAALPGVADVNAAEPMLAPATSVRPRVRLGCTLQQAWGGEPDGAGLAAWLALYEGEDYALAWRGGTAWVAVKQGATPRDLLRAVWQAAWLDAAAGDGGASGATVGPGDAALLRDSLAAAQQRSAGFLASLSAAGWDLSVQPVLQVEQARIVVERQDPRPAQCN